MSRFLIYTRESGQRRFCAVDKDFRQVTRKDSAHLFSHQSTITALEKLRSQGVEAKVMSETDNCARVNPSPNPRKKITPDHVLECINRVTGSFLPGGAR